MSLGNIKTRTRQQTRQRQRSPQRQRAQQRPRETAMSEAKLKQLLAPLEEASEERDELKSAWKDKVHIAQMAALKASEEGVPLKLIIEAGNFTRQYFYQIEKDFEAGKLTNSAVSSEKATVPKRVTPSNRTSASKRVVPVRETRKQKLVSPLKRTKPSKRSRIRTH